MNRWDHVTEMDELFQNVGEKGIPHRDPDDPPRRRANKRRGHGTFENDRPPVVGVVGRESGEVRMKAVEHTDGATLEAVAEGVIPIPFTRPAGLLRGLRREAWPSRRPTCG